MKPETKTLAWKLVKVGIVSGLVGIPVGLWLIPKFRGKEWVPALALSGVAFLVKEVMLREHGKEIARMGPAVSKAT